MPTHRSAEKRLRQNLKAAHRNKHYKSLMKTAIKKVLQATTKEAAEEHFRKASSILDKLVYKGIIHCNKAANQKARLARRVNALAA